MFFSPTISDHISLTNKK